MENIASSMEKIFCAEAKLATIGTIRNAEMVHGEMASSMAAARRKSAPRRKTIL